MRLELALKAIEDTYQEDVRGAFRNLVLDLASDPNNPEQAQAMFRDRVARLERCVDLAKDAIERPDG